jgi:hypothetical protein
MNREELEQSKKHIERCTQEYDFDDMEAGHRKLTIPPQPENELHHWMMLCFGMSVVYFIYAAIALGGDINRGDDSIWGWHLIAASVFIHLISGFYSVDIQGKLKEAKALRIAWQELKAAITAHNEHVKDNVEDKES